jgi:hypothetical protein
VVEIVARAHASYFNVNWDDLSDYTKTIDLEAAAFALSAIEASGRRIVPVEPKSRARELWEDAVRDALSASPKVTP